MAPSVNETVSAATASSATVPCIVDNAPLQTSATYDVISPADRKTVVHTVSSLGADQVAKVVASSQAAFKSWKDTSIPAKRAIFNKAAELLRERTPQFIANQATETTSSEAWAAMDIGGLTPPSLDEGSAAMMAALRGEIAPYDGSHEGKRMFVTRAPFGCVLSIVPWNAPSVLCMRALINPLAAGNCVILRTSEYSPQTHLNIAQCFIDAGLPKGVLNVVHTRTQDSPEVTKALIEADFVRKVNFTGSTRVGSIIASLCAKQVKPVLLELGGKAPVIVTEEADIPLAANNIIFGALKNQGQICMATANVLVHVSRKNELEEELSKQMAESQEHTRASAASTLSTSSSDKPSHKLRGLFSTASAVRVQSLWEEAAKQGAEVFAGQQGIDTELGVVQPVFVRGTPSMSIFSEELFAPIVGVYAYESDAEAIKLANAPGMGLTASVFSKDETHAWRLASEIESGAVHINGMTVHDDSNIPHGGCRSSGYGRFNGIDGIREFTYSKQITITPGSQIPLQFL